MHLLEAEEFLSKRAAYPVLDIRSPSEYLQGHIPGAVSFPLFSDQERAQVGKTYKLMGKREALKVGLEKVGPKMAEYVRKAEALETQTFLIHCWRGGMRSSSMGWLLNTAGFEALALTGGYKAYRGFLIQKFNDPINFKVITGSTGTGKTALLKALIEVGAQVIDLEALANHNGSSFGNQLSHGQPSTEQFQNNLLEELLRFDLRKPVWVEDESFMIGKVHVPEAFYLQKQSADHIHVSLARPIRVNNLVSTYGVLPAEQLIRATESIRKKLGGKETDAAIHAIKNENLHEAACFILRYYDKAYEKSLENKKDRIVASLTLEEGKYLALANYLHSTYA